MSKSKRVYSNPYTILEKVRQGKIDTYYKEKDGLFGKVDFYKRPDLIKPHLYFLDETKVKDICKNHLKNDAEIVELYKKVYGVGGPKTHEHFLKFKVKMLEIFDKHFANHMVSDIFKLYYNKIEDLSFENRTDKNKNRYKVIEKVNNPVGKIMSESSNLKSAIFTRNIVAEYLARLSYEEIENPPPKDKNDKNQDPNEKLDSMLDRLNGNGSSSNGDFNKDLEKAINNAMQECKDIDQNLTEEDQNYVYKEMSKSSNASKTSSMIKDIVANLTSVNLNMSSLKEKIKLILNKSASYHSAKEFPFYEDILNTDNIGNLDDFINLHPRIRKFLLEDVLIKDTYKKGKVDIYLDVSGSMDSHSGSKNAKGQEISKLDFAKALIAKIYDMEMLEKLYLFNTSVFERSSTKLSIATIDTSGGTSIDSVLTHMQTTTSNAIIITDAEDHCRQYNERAFFIGTLGCNFKNFSFLREYVSKGQMIEFSGNKIKMIKETGKS